MVVVQGSVAHLPLHADEGGGVRVVRQTRPLRVRLLKACQVAHIGWRATVATRCPAERR